MRKLTSKEEERKKQKRKQTIVGIVLIGVLVVSVFGIFVNSFGQNNAQGTSLEYRGYNFVKQNNYWYLQVDENRQFAFAYNPLEINSFIQNSSVEFQGQIKKLNSYVNEPLYIYSEDYRAKSEIYRNLYGIAQRSQDACPAENITSKYPELEPLECESKWPIKTCNDNLIIINTYENNSEKSGKIIQDNNCLIIQGKKGEEITKLTDKALLKIIGFR